MAIAFDGSDDYVVTTTLGDFGSSMAQGFSLSLWFKTASSANGMLAGWVNGPAGEYNTSWVVMLNEDQNGIATPDRIRFFCRDEGADKQMSCCCTFNTDDSLWHHLSIIANFPSDADVEFWVDGVQKTTTYSGNNNAPDNPADATVPIVIGGHNSRGTPNAVDIPVSLADVFLTKSKWGPTIPPEIYRLRRVPWRLFDSNVVAYWPLAGPTSTTVSTAHWGGKDLSGNGNSISSVNSAPTWEDDPLAPQAWTEGLFGGAWATTAAANVIPVMDYYYRRRRTA